MEAKLEAPGFWNDTDESQIVMKELKGLKDALESINNLETHFEDIETLIEMAEEEQDGSLIEEISESINTFTEEFESFRIETLLSDEFDAKRS